MKGSQIKTLLSLILSVGLLTACSKNSSQGETKTAEQASLTGKPLKIGVLIDGSVPKKRASRAKTASAEKIVLEEDLPVFEKGELEELAAIEHIESE